MIETVKQNLALIAFPYLFFISAFYHVGYWSQFNIEILNYLGLQDSINGILFPVIHNIQGHISTLFFAVFLFSIFSITVINTNKSLGFVFKQVTIINLIFSLYLVLKLYESDYIIGILEFLNIQFFIFILAIIILIIKPIYVNKLKLSSIHFSTNNLVFVLVASIPLYTFLAGFKNATYIKRGYKYQYTETRFTNDSIGFEGTRRLIFLGKGGETYFFTSPSYNFNVITNQSNFKNLVLKEFRIKSKLEN